jgi:geranylgeranyl pyrophosphate synthase
VSSVRAAGAVARGLRGTLDTRDELHRVLDAFSTSLPVAPGLEPHLGGLVRDVLAHPGSLLRARLAYGVAHRFGVAEAPALDLAVAIEYFHTASLVLDDLPAMDDAETRRGRICPHRIYGESAAILGSLALINRAYFLLWGVLGELPTPRRQLARELVDACLGLTGILDGQSRDLHFAENPRQKDLRREVLAVAEGKTVTLVRLTLLLPALVAGADAPEIELQDRLAQAWGLAYQVLDDFKDSLMTDKESGKTSQRDHALGRPNLPAVEGEIAAWQRLDLLLADGRHLLGELVEHDRRWGVLSMVQEVLENSRAALALRIQEAA